jgi:hypothetical protein
MGPDNQNFKPRWRGTPTGRKSVSRLRNRELPQGGDDRPLKCNSALRTDVEEATHGLWLLFQRHFPIPILVMETEQVSEALVSNSTWTQLIARKAARASS